MVQQVTLNGGRPLLPRKKGSRFAILLRTSIPNFDGLPRQSRRSFPFTLMKKLPHLTHIRTPLWWKILCALWTLIAPRSGTLFEHSFALFPSWRSPLATHRPRAHLPRRESQRLHAQNRSTADLSANSLPAYIQKTWCPDHENHSLVWLFDLHDKDRRNMARATSHCVGTRIKGWRRFAWRTGDRLSANTSVKSRTATPRPQRPGTTGTPSRRGT